MTRLLDRTFTFAPARSPAGWMAALSLALSFMASTARAEGSGDVFPPGFVVEQPGGQATMTVSEEFMGALDVIGVRHDPVAPATLSYDSETSLLSTHMPLSRIVGHANTLFVDLAEASGGVSFTRMPRGSSNGGESISLSDWRIDLRTRDVYVDVTGSNGVGNVRNVHMWRFEHIEGERMIDITPCPAAQPLCIPEATMRETQLTGMTITTEGLDLFVASLGLSPTARMAMVQSTDFGSITLSPVPEPSAALLMLAGLAGVALLAAKRRPTDFGVSNSQENRSH